MNRFRGTSARCLGTCALALAGCADGPESSISGRRILADLERAGISVPPERPEDYAQTTPPALPQTGPIRLQDLWAVAEAANPDLAAARSRVGIAAGHTLQASRYPNPRLELQAEEIPADGGFSRSTNTIGITQPIVLGDRRRLAVAAAEADQQASLARLELRRRQLLADVAVEYARLIAARDADRLNAELRTLASQTLSIAQTRLDAGAVSQTEVLRPRVEIDRLEIASAHALRQGRAASERLGLLLGGRTVDTDRLDGGDLAALHPIDLYALEQSIQSDHPALAAAGREIDAASARLEQARAQRTPDLDLRLAAGHRGEDDEAIVEIGAGLEIPFWDRHDGEILAARFDLMRARQESRAVENELRSRLSASHAEYESARERWEATRDRVIPALQRAFEQTSDAYRAGRVPFLEMLEAQRSLAEARVSLLDTAAAAAAARAQLIELFGPDLLRAQSGHARDATPEPTLIRR